MDVLEIALSVMRDVADDDISNNNNNNNNNDTGNSSSSCKTKVETAVGEDPDQAKIATMFILWGVVLPFVVNVGLVGNGLTMAVLWRREMQSTTALYLRALAITDTGILLLALLGPIPLILSFHVEGPISYFSQCIYPVIETPRRYTLFTLRLCNLWIIVTASIERYIAICHPFKAARFLSRRTTLITIYAIAAVSIIYTLPRLFASTYTTPSPQESSPPANDNNGTEEKSTDCDFYYNYAYANASYICRKQLTHNTTLGQSLFYELYCTVVHAANFMVIPVTVLIVTNGFVIKELATMKRRRRATMSVYSHDVSEVDDEDDLSICLVLIIVVFVLCQTPDLVTQFYDLLGGILSLTGSDKNNNNNNTVFYLRVVGVVLMTTNSAVNFLIYTAFGRKFRKVLLLTFRRIKREGGRQMSIVSSSRLRLKKLYRSKNKDTVTVGVESNTSNKSFQLDDKESKDTLNDEQ